MTLLEAPPITTTSFSYADNKQRTAFGVGVSVTFCRCNWLVNLDVIIINLIIVKVLKTIMKTLLAILIGVILGYAWAYQVYKAPIVRVYEDGSFVGCFKGGQCND